MEESKTTGRAKGGKKRAEVLSPEQRKEIALKGAAARWGERPIQAIHKGSFKQEFGVDVECYVLDDPNKTAVISKTGMGRALGLSSRGNAFPRFLESKAMTETIGAQLREKLDQPLKFQWSSGGAQPSVEVHGFDATLLVEALGLFVFAQLQKNMY